MQLMHPHKVIFYKITRVTIGGLTEKIVREIRDALQEAQETAENLLLFSADIGKEMQKIKTAQGFASSIPDADGKNAETKTQTIHSMGFTDR